MGADDREFILRCSRIVCCSKCASHINYWVLTANDYIKVYELKYLGYGNPSSKNVVLCTKIIFVIQVSSLDLCSVQKNNIYCWIPFDQIQSVDPINTLNLEVENATLFPQSIVPRRHYMHSLHQWRAIDCTIPRFQIYKSIIYNIYTWLGKA